MKIEVTIYGERRERRVSFPAEWVICDECRGEGKSSAYLGAYTMDEMDEAGPEFEEDYFAGRYDRTCECCKGSGKLKVIDYDRVRGRLQEAYLRAYQEQEREERAYQRICAAERRMGA
jgi:hypothetical protein